LHSETFQSFKSLKLADAVSQDAERDPLLKQEAAAARLARVADAVLKAPKITRSMDDDVRLTTV